MNINIALCNTICKIMDCATIYEYDYELQNNSARQFVYK